MEDENVQQTPSIDGEELEKLRRENEELKAQIKAIADKQHDELVDAAKKLAVQKLPAGVLHEDAPIYAIIDAMPEQVIAFLEEYPENVTTAKLTPEDVDEDAGVENPFFG